MTKEPHQLAGSHVVSITTENNQLFSIHGKATGMSMNNQNKAEMDYLVEFSDGTKEVWSMTKVWKSLFD